MQELKSEELYGIAKKVNSQLDDLPLHTHSAIVEMIRVGFEHRKLVMQRAQYEEQVAMQERQMRLREQELSLANEGRDRAVAEGLKPHLVEQEAAQ